MIDSTDPNVIERALTYCQGKSIINSINLEDGEERFEQVVPWRAGTAPRWSSVRSTRKAPGDGAHPGAEAGDGSASLRSPGRQVRRATRGYHLRPPGLPVRDRRQTVLRLGAGDDRGHPPDQGGASRSARRFWGSATSPSVCRPPGGKCSTPSSSTTARRPASTWRSSTRRSSSGTLVSRRTKGSWPSGSSSRPATRRIAEFVEHFRGEGKPLRPARESLPLDERLARYIIEGSKDGLIEDLDLKLKEAAPLEIINGP